MRGALEHVVPLVGLGAAGGAAGGAVALQAPSDTVQIVTALCAAATAIVTAWIAYQTARLNRLGEGARRDASVAAVRAEETRSELRTVHALVNGKWGAQLRATAILARRLADLTGHPDDAAAASAAERMSREHDLAQSRAREERA